MSPMYNSFEDIESALRRWLEPVPIAFSATVVYSGSIWYQSHFFRTPESYHIVYYDPATGYFAFHVEAAPNASDAAAAALPTWAGQCKAPNMGVYESWDTMIAGIANAYGFLWLRPTGQSI